jgi:hypothetical protein
MSDACRSSVFEKQSFTYREADEDVAAVLLERRWFAAFRAASSARAECEALLDAMDATERAWNEARIRLAELEMLRDSLSEQLASIDGAGREGMPIRAEVQPA